MITTRQDNSNKDKPKLVIEIDNGDLEALNSVADSWNFINVASLMRFTLAVMRRSTDHALYVKDETGKQAAFAPADSLLKTDSTSVGDNPDGEDTK